MGLVGAGLGIGSVGTGNGGCSGGTGISGGMLDSVSSVLILVLEWRAGIAASLFISTAIMGSSYLQVNATSASIGYWLFAQRPTPQTPSGALALAPGDRTLPVEHRGPGRAKLMKDVR